MIHQTITRKGSFDSMHRVMNERMKCFNVHGHTYLYELTFSFDSIESIGYAIDFKEIKRIACQWIDDILDHGAILNPQDTILVKASIDLHSKLWLMSLNGHNEYCNPSVENVAKELFLAISYLLDTKELKLEKVRLYETPNCYTDCWAKSITSTEKTNFYQTREPELQIYKTNKGIIEYDDRKINL
jgi:6-pyruvoyltetrahydropterin/6-carboxytetrahydropterin synthase